MKWSIPSLMLVVVGITPVQADLLPRLSGQAYYDTQANLTWLADANHARTSGYDADGLMNWQDANAWAASLNIGGVGGWRLPRTLQPDLSCSVQGFGSSLGNNCRGSELGNLFYNVLGGVATIAISDTHNANFHLFSNIQISGYWSETEFAPDPLHQNAWAFGMGGVQVFVNKATLEPHAWAVHDGDVSAVPVPAAVWLLGAGVMTLLGLPRTRRRLLAGREHSGSTA